jgi:opacity protein-like surface antigen
MKLSQTRLFSFFLVSTYLLGCNLVSQAGTVNPHIEGVPSPYSEPPVKYQRGILSPLWSWLPDLDKVVTLSLGSMWSKNGRTQTIFLQPDLEKMYYAKKENSGVINGELFLGLQRPITSALGTQFGLDLGQTAAAKFNGDIWEDADPEFNNYVYHYHVKRTYVGIKGKVLAIQTPLVQPYVSGSIGVSFNRASSFSITPKIYEEVPADPFTNHTRSAFSYTLGAGIQKPLSTHFSGGVGYEFSDWGKNHLGRTHTQTVNTGISLSHVYVNSLLFNITYLG